MLQMNRRARPGSPSAIWLEGSPAAIFLSFWRTVALSRQCAGKCRFSISARTSASVVSRGTVVMSGRGLSRHRKNDVPPIPITIVCILTESFSYRSIKVFSLSATVFVFDFRMFCVPSGSCLIDDLFVFAA
jgi:hypothetical protein